MVPSITVIDHAVILVRDLDTALNACERLGFVASPRGFHSKHMGTANHTIMLDDDYFEVLSVLTPTDANARWRTFLESGDGLGIIPLRTSDARLTFEELRAAGIDAAEPLHFERPVQLPDGGEAMAAFEVVMIPPEATPGLITFACHHLTPEVVWLPELKSHPNGACAIDSVTMVVERTQGLAESYQRLFGAKATSVDAERFRLKSDSAPIDFLSRDAFRDDFPGLDLPRAGLPQAAVLTLRTRDLAKARAFLEQGGVRFSAHNDRLYVAANDACGVILGFCSA